MSSSEPRGSCETLGGTLMDVALLAVSALAVTLTSDTRGLSCRRPPSYERCRDGDLPLTDEAENARPGW